MFDELLLNITVPCQALENRQWGVEPRSLRSVKSSGPGLGIHHLGSISSMDELEEWSEGPSAKVEGEGSYAESRRWGNLSKSMSPAGER